MQAETLCKWDEIASKEVEKAGMTFHESVRVYAYLYQAQSEAALLSNYHGSLDPVSGEVLALFFPDVQREKGDEYSEKLAEAVVAKMKERMAAEEASEPMFTCPPGKMNSYGQEMAKWKPWYISCPTNYWPCCPPDPQDPFWKWQIAQMKQEQEPLTEAKKEAVQFWAGLTKPGAGDWRHLANDDLFCRNVCLEDALEVRSVLMASLYDVAIVCFTAKYHYMMPRPKVLDPSVEYEIPVPAHPSYPSGHSTDSGAAATILSFFFPQQSCQWWALAEEAGMSRIWAGIHYPIDNEQGLMVGRAVAEAVLLAWMQCQVAD